MANMEQESALMSQLKLEQVAKSGARWFYWIAGFSAFNSMSVWLNLGWSFFVGLGITQIFDGVGSTLGVLGAIAAVGLDVGVVGGFVLAGYLAHKYRAAFLVGVGFYALDGLLLLFFREYVYAGFHLFAIFFILQGYKAAKALAATPTTPGAFYPVAAPEQDAST